MCKICVEWMNDKMKEEAKSWSKEKDGKKNVWDTVGGGDKREDR